MRKILAVTGSEDLRDILYRTMRNEFDLTICGSALDCMNLLQEDFDGMILDLFLPETDGLTLLERMADRRPPVILVLTRLYSDYILQALESCGVGYVIRIPCPIEEVKNRMNDMFRKFDTPASEDPLDRVRYHLRRLGLSPRWNGYHHLMYILPLYDPYGTSALFSTFYQDLAARNSVTVDAIDNAIHQTIRRAYEKRNESVWAAYFPDTSQCPKNKDFIASIAEQIK